MKNGNELGVLKRYGILIIIADGCARARIEEREAGSWVKYYDYDNLARRKELVHRKLIATLNRERTLRHRIRELEKDIAERDANDGRT